RQPHARRGEHRLGCQRGLSAGVRRNRAARPQPRQCAVRRLDRWQRLPVRAWRTAQRRNDLEGEPVNPMPPPRDALRLEGACKDFGDRRALQSLSLSIAPGEIYALLGPNGAGKTTTLNLILGFLDLDRGRIEVAGIDVGRDPIGARAKIAYLPETVML